MNNPHIRALTLYEIRSIYKKYKKNIGIYRIKNKSGDVVYIGLSTTSLSDRILHRPFQFTESNRYSFYENAYSVDIMIVEGETQARILEIYFINYYRPIYNTQDKAKDGSNIDLSWFVKERKYEWINIIPCDYGNILLTDKHKDAIHAYEPEKVQQ